MHPGTQANPYADRAIEQASSRSNEFISRALREVGFIMPHRIRLDQAINQILDAIVGAIEAEVTEGGLLEEVKTVIRGDKTRPKPETPSVFVFTDVARAEASPRTTGRTSGRFACE